MSAILGHDATLTVDGQIVKLRKVVFTFDERSLVDLPVKPDDMVIKVKNPVTGEEREFRIPKTEPRCPACGSRITNHGH